MFKILAVSLFALLATPVVSAMADAPALNRTITLNGHGEVRAAPDMAVIDLGVFAQGDTARAALDANTKNMAALLAMLKAEGIDDKDVQTSNFSVGPRYDNPQNGTQPKVIGYDVNNTVSVIVRKLPELGALLDKAVSSGSNQVNNLTFTMEDAANLQDEARKAAVKDALRKAELLAGAAGSKVGPVVSISDMGSPGPMPMRAGAMMDMAKAAPVPVAQGQLVISADVNMVWELTAP
ncbi:SIMPL domain-containing protein [Aestuariivirga litoralis]|uniref:SIMPL domain-containing protein n=1 Tax=Aestuariivirga litoralis TaxID=2650924 RepID=UPI0018C69B56|nr:SIMPL domain-containing protein [Aestuariivirga litoralis]MBG1232162.1 SIMPL domain-containing protein [Aestuariivirga litoralis]